MSGLLLARLDADLLYPPLVSSVLDMLGELQRAGHEFWGVSGFRDEAEQMRLWTQGRTRSGLVVTNARAWESPHNYGLAVDLCRDSNMSRMGLQPSWRPDDYAVLDRACRMHGLEWGGWWKFKDYPHVQLPGYVTVQELKPLREVYASAKGSQYVRLSAVWDYLDEKSEPKTPAN